MNKFIVLLLSLTSFLTAYHGPADERDPTLGGFYINGFTGWGLSTSSLYQNAIAYNATSEGDNIYVNAYGNSQNSYLWYGGVTLGYDFTGTERNNYHITHAVELEGYYFANTYIANCQNESFHLEIHDFKITLPSQTGILLGNLLFQYPNQYLTPYIGIGIGSDMVNIANGYSEQTEPEEPGINHFNSDPNDFEWSFTTQVKGGIFHTFTTNYMVHVRVFLEYRFLYQSPAVFTFGNTLYPGQPETSNWKIHLSDRYTNMFGGGIAFIF